MNFANHFMNDDPRTVGLTPPGPHGYGFDPAHGHSLEQLLAVPAPDEPEDYAAFWRARYEAARNLDLKATLNDTGRIENGWKVYDLAYTSTGGTKIRGWALQPEHGAIKRGIVVGHGYGGREAPDTDLPVEDAVLFFPCARGLGRSWHPSIPATPYEHVLYGIQDRDKYVLGGCVEDVWVAVSVMLGLFPQVTGRVGYMGISFGGGIGAMAVPWESRIQRSHLNVPTFGNQPLRMKLATHGSAASVQNYERQHPEVQEVLRYYDAACAARYITTPLHAALALFDPAVAPAGQFSIYNALAGPKELFVLSAGHHPYATQDQETVRLRQELHTFFQAL
jgi:cephalosporin-C deacetylase